MADPSRKPTWGVLMPVDPGFHLSTTTGAARTFRSEQPIRVRPVGESVEVEEKPALVITDPEGFLWVTATVELLKIEEDYTYAGFAWQGPVATNQRGDFLTVGGALDQPGIYLVSAVTLATAPPATVMPLSRLQLGVCLFEVRAATDEPRSHTELVQSVADILERRERLVLEGIGKDPDEHGVRTHEVLVFLKNCLVSQRMRLRGCEIVPHEAMTVASEFDCMERYRPFAEREAVLGNYRSEQPTAVVHFPRVYATSREEAEVWPGITSRFLGTRSPSTGTPPQWPSARFSAKLVRLPRSTASTSKATEATS